MNFDKRQELFPVKKRYIFLNGCGVAPLSRPAAEKEAELAARLCEHGGTLGAADYDQVLDRLHAALGAILGTGKENISFVKNTAEALGIIANGFPLQPGDEIVSYVHEYPSNHYPWKVQERRGARLVLLPDSDLLGLPAGRPRAWSLADLERLVTKRTRIVALSHVQFTSGFAADLEQLGRFCRERRIALVIDAAQSVGCLPLRPDEWGIAAIAASGWKWLLGPIGCGLLYTSPDFREQLEPIMTGPELMRQGANYLDHSWAPWQDGRKFEYSTVPYTLAAALLASCEEIFCRYQPEGIRAEVFRLQSLLLKDLDPALFQPVIFPERHRSGILSLIARQPERLAAALEKRGLICSTRGGYLRLAPHFYIDDEETARAAKLLNETAAQ